MKILVIEDEPKVASFVKRGLEELSYDVEVAYDGFIGEKLALSGTYDIILLDIVIPAKNGIDLCRVIKFHKPEVPHPHAYRIRHYRQGEWLRGWRRRLLVKTF